MKAAFAAYKYRQNNVKVQQNVAHIKVIQRNELNYRILHLHTSLYRIHTKATVLFRQGRSPHSTKIKKKGKRVVKYDFQLAGYNLDTIPYEYRHLIRTKRDNIL